jgi:hypothetical protein
MIGDMATPRRGPGGRLRFFPPAFFPADPVLALVGLWPLAAAANDPGPEPPRPKPVRAPRPRPPAGDEAEATPPPRWLAAAA